MILRRPRYDRRGEAWHLTNKDFFDLRNVFEAIDADGTGNLSCSEITEFAQGLPSMLLERHRNLAFTGQHDNTPYAGDTLVGNAQILQVHTTRLRWTNTIARSPTAKEGDPPNKPFPKDSLGIFCACTYQYNHVVIIGTSCILYPLPLFSFSPPLLPHPLLYGHLCVCACVRALRYQQLTGTRGPFCRRLPVLLHGQVRPS